MRKLTAEIAAFVAGNRYDAIPDAAIGAIKNALSDYAAVTVLGAEEEASRIVASFEDIRPEGEACICFSDRRAPARAAALINGTAAHAHDYDDVGIAFHPAHPSVAMAPAVLAQAEAQNASGKQVLEAFATGYEVWSELASRDAKPHHLRGVHPTGFFGTVAAAAGVARLMELDQPTASNALAIAASQAAGLVANFGSMTKPFHAGRAAAAGLMSARYAAAGMTASSEVFEHKHGFLRALSPEGTVDLERPCHFGASWHLVDHGIGVKLYPLCYGNHRIINTLTKYVNSTDLPPADIDHVAYRTAPSRVVALVHTDPKTPLDAKFSAEFAVAMSVIAKRATLAEVTDEFFGRTDVRELMGKVERDLDPAREPASFNGEAEDLLEFRMKDGSVRRLTLESPDDLAISLDRNILWAKFRDCTSPSMDEQQARGLFDALQNLEHLDDIRELPVYKASSRTH
ncbi:MAG: MmgE/PrpD family protein [Hyphomicrobiales bacterium]|nr:MmgE/PrpD family protein [Hyphomicrobiales bacterium]